MDPHKNFIYTTVSNSPGTSGTGWIITSATGWPSPGTDGAFNIVVCPANARPTTATAEIVRVTARSSTLLTVARAQEGTSAINVASGYQVYLSATAKTFTDIESAVASVNSALSSLAFPGVIVSTPTTTSGDTKYYTINFGVQYNIIPATSNNGTIVFNAVANKVAGTACTFLIPPSIDNSSTTIVFDTIDPTAMVTLPGGFPGDKAVIMTFTSFGNSGGSQADVYYTLVVQP
jgi:hypothetical protein